MINFDDTSGQAFYHGFLKGLAAPAMLFHVEHIRPLVIAPLALPARSDAESLASDWRKVGGDLRRAIDQHGKAA